MFTGNVFNIKTNAEFHFGTVWLVPASPQQMALTFRVQACNDVHLGLSDVPVGDSTANYEVVIGGWSNSKSAIRKPSLVNYIFICGGYFLHHDKG